MNKTILLTLLFILFLPTSLRGQDKSNTPDLPDKFFSHLEKRLLPALKAHNSYDIIWAQIRKLTLNKKINSSYLLENFELYLKRMIKKKDADFKAGRSYLKAYYMGDILARDEFSSSHNQTISEFSELNSHRLSVPRFYPDYKSKDAARRGVSADPQKLVESIRMLAGGSGEHTALEWLSPFLWVKGDIYYHSRLQRILNLFRPQSFSLFQWKMKVVTSPLWPSPRLSTLSEDLSELSSWQGSCRAGEIVSLWNGESSHLLMEYTSAPRIKSPHLRPVLLSVPEGLSGKLKIEGPVGKKLWILSHRFKFSRLSQPVSEVKIPQLGPLHLPRQFFLSRNIKTILPSGQWVLLGERRGLFSNQKLALYGKLKISRRQKKKSLQEISKLDQRKCLLSIILAMRKQARGGILFDPDLPKNIPPTSITKTYDIRWMMNLGKTSSYLPRDFKFASSKRKGLSPFPFQTSQESPIYREYYYYPHIYPDKVIEVMKNVLGGKHFIDDSNTSLAYYKGYLFLTNTPKIHKKMEKTLEKFRQKIQTRPLYIRLIHFTLPKNDSLKDLTSSKSLSPKELKSLLKRLPKKNIHLISGSAGRMGRPLTFRDEIHTNYISTYRIVKRYEKKVYPLPRPLPEVSTLQTGLHARALLIETPKGQKFYLHGILRKKVAMKTIKVAARPLHLPKTREKSFQMSTKFTPGKAYLVRLDNGEYLLAWPQLLD